jgi:hypothetical protein
MFWKKCWYRAVELFGWRFCLGPPNATTGRRRVQIGVDFVLEDRTAPAAYYWTGADAATGNSWWSNAGNWGVLTAPGVLGPAPTPPGAGDDVTLGIVGGVGSNSLSLLDASFAGTIQSLTILPGYSTLLVKRSLTITGAGPLPSSAAGGTIDGGNQTLTVSANTFTQSGAAISNLDMVMAPTSTLNVTGGTWLGGLITTQKGPTPPQNATFTASGGTTSFKLDNGGTASISGVSLGTVNNSGTLTMQANAKTSTVVNTGTLNVNNGLNNSCGGLDNQGTLSLNGGILTLPSGGVQSTAGASTVFNGGELDVPTGSYTLNGGNLYGNASGSLLAGALVNLGGTVYAGGTTGTFVVGHSSYTQGPAGTLFIQIDVDKGTNSFLRATVANLAGTLRVEWTDGIPTLADVWTIGSFNAQGTDFTTLTGNERYLHLGSGTSPYFITLWQPLAGLNGTTTTVASSADPSVFGQDVTLTATVSGGSGTPTGSVTFLSDDNVLGTASLSNGVASLTTSALAVGTDEITAIYNGDSNFSDSASTALAQVVGSNDTVTLSSSLTSALAGTPVTLTAAVSATTSGTPTGAVDFWQVDPETGMDLALLGTATLDASGDATLTVSTLPAGSDAIEAAYLGDANFSPGSSSSVTETITAAPTIDAVTPSTGAVTGATVAIFGQYFTGATAVSFGGTPATTITVVSDSEILAVAPGESAGAVDVTVTTGAGTSATSPADLFTYSDSLSGTTLALSSAGTTTYGQALTLTATVSGGSGTPTGLVLFLDGDGAVLGTAYLDSTGVATLSLSNLPAGDGQVTAVYVGDEDNAGSAAVLPQTVNQADTTITLGSSSNPAAAGTPLTLTATVASTTSGTPTGGVTFWQVDPVTGADLALLGTGMLDPTGQAMLTVSDLPVRSDAVQAVYLGDQDFNPGSATLTEVITATPTISAVTPNNGSASGGATVAIFGQYLTGATAVSFGGTPATSFSVVSDNEIVAVAPAEPAGSVDVTVTTGNGTSATNPGDQFTFSSMLSSTTLSLSSSAGTTTYGQALTLTATVSAGSGTPTGTVTFLDGDGNVLGSSFLSPSGIATLTVTNLPAGDDLVTAGYGGDPSFAGSVATPLDQAVTTADTTLTLTSSASPALAGTPVTLTAAVAATTTGTPTGTVLFWQVDPVSGDDVALLGTGTLDAFGQAALTLSTLPAGSDAVQAVYLGDSNFNPNSSAVLTEVVNLATTTTWLTGPLVDVTVGQPVTFNVGVSSVGGGTPTGTVSFYDGTTLLGTATLDAMGMASLTVTDLSVGLHDITAVYSGDACNAGSTSNVVQQQIDAVASSTALTSSQNPAPAGTPLTLTATVSSLASGTPTGTVQFWILDPMTLEPLTLLGTATLDSSGQASLTVSSLSSGSYLLEALYLGDSTFSSSSGTVNQDIS